MAIKSKKVSGITSYWKTANDTANIIASNGQDLIYGSALGEKIVAGNGQDTIYAGGGDDLIYGDSESSLCTTSNGVE